MRKNRQVQPAILSLILFLFGCYSEQPHISRLTTAERDVLQTYYNTPDMLEKAARICLNRELTKNEVLIYTSDIMRREVKENSITFYYAPSQLWIITFGGNGKAIAANMGGGKIITRDESELIPNQSMDPTDSGS